jgi:hypothetical protein
MRRWIAVLLFAMLVAEVARAEPPAKTSTVVTTLSAEDLELARYLMLLENLDLLEEWDMLELWPVLEEEEED